MRRSRFPQAAFARLAVLAMVLMVCAPLVSRCLQSGPAYAELCTAEGLKRVALPSPPPMDAGPHAAHAAGSDAGMAATTGGSHGDAACDYCLLGLRLMPLLLCVLMLMASPARVPRPAAERPRWGTVAWPAHPARGPPLYA